MGQKVILFAGGGTGGHIFPNLAIWERLRELRPDCQGHFLVSRRPLDGQILDENHIPYTGLPAEPLGLHPRKLLAFVRGYWASQSIVRKLLQQQEVAAVVATGGFVSGPAVAAAAGAGLPAVLVNLDAVPGKANRAMAAKATRIFTAYPWPQAEKAKTIGLPLRRVAVGGVQPAVARERLSLDPQRDTLLVIGGSQGASSIDGLMIELSTRPELAALLQDRQVLHIAAPARLEEVQLAYQQAHTPAKVVAFCPQVGLAWAAATVALSRAGASCVAEAWANAVPTLFLPYPYHKDQHQRLNALPLEKLGGAVILQDRIAAGETADEVAPVLRQLLADESRRAAMVHALQQQSPGDGALTVAQYLADLLPPGPAPVRTR